MKPTIKPGEMEKIIARMGEGMSLKASCAVSGVKYSFAFDKITASEELRQLYARARADYAHSKVDEMHEIAVNEPDVARARLMIDVIKWEVSKVIPKEYGDKVQAEITGEGGGPLQVTVQFVAPKDGG